MESDAIINLVNQIGEEGDQDENRLFLQQAFLQNDLDSVSWLCTDVMPSEKCRILCCAAR